MYVEGESGSDRKMRLLRLSHLQVLLLNHKFVNT